MENPWKYKKCSQNSTFTIFVSYVLSTFILKSKSTPSISLFGCKKYVVSSEKSVFYVSILNTCETNTLFIVKLALKEVGIKEKKL